MFGYFDLISNWNNFLRSYDNTEGYEKYNKYLIIYELKEKTYSWDIEKDTKYTRKEIWDRLHKLLNNNKDLNEKFLNFILSVQVNVIA